MLKGSKYLFFIDPLIGSAALQGAASVFGGIFGGSKSLKAQREANATNLKIAEMNNQAAKEMHEQQNAWNIEQWERNNEYNTPAAQMQRLREGGLNPAAMNSVDGGTSSSPASSDTPPSLQQASVIPEDAFGQAFGKSISAGIQDMVAAEQIRNLSLDADKKEKELPFVVDLSKGKVILQNTTINSVIQNISHSKQEQRNLEQSYNNMVAQHDLLVQNLTNMRLDADAKTIENKFLEEYKRLQNEKLKSDIRFTDKSLEDLSASIAQRLASVSLMNKQGNLADAQAQYFSNLASSVSLDVQWGEVIYPVTFELASNQADISSINLGILKDFGVADKIANYITQAYHLMNESIQSVASVINAVKSKGGNSVSPNAPNTPDYWNSKNSSGAYQGNPPPFN